MNEMVIHASIPLDDDQYLRRECPHCIQEFKIQIADEDLKSYVQHHLESFLTDESDIDEEVEVDIKYHCPYCGQVAPSTQWWTQEQLAYLKIFGKNIIAKIVNENLIKPMKRLPKSRNEFLSISFSGEEMQYEEPWISEEVNDMEIFSLPCCSKEIKILEAPHSHIFCFHCGFKHQR